MDLGGYVGNSVGNSLHKESVGFDLEFKMEIIP
jgi:hypothetical protein